MEFNVEGKVVEVDIERIINAGYTGRDQEAVEKHIDELMEEGIDAPDEVPITFELAPYSTLVDPGEITVVGEQTSGEAEFGLIVTGSDTYVVAASDQTDRKLESESIQLSKQIAPNIVSRCAWNLDDVRKEWDGIEIRAMNTRNGAQKIYQDATLGDILPPEELINICEQRYSEPLTGTIILSGTVPTVSGELPPGDQFNITLNHPANKRELNLSYDINAVTD